MDDSKTIEQCPYLSDDFCLNYYMKDNHATCATRLKQIEKIIYDDETPHPIN